MDDGIVGIVDWSRVRALHAEIGTADFREVVDLFLEEVDETVARLRAHDAASLAADLHFLKGSALSLGFVEFAGLCAAGERHAESGAAAAPDLPAVRAAWTRGKDRFLTGLADQAF